MKTRGFLFAALVAALVALVAGVGGLLAFYPDVDPKMEETTSTGDHVLGAESVNSLLPPADCRLVHGADTRRQVTTVNGDPFEASRLMIECQGGYSGAFVADEEIWVAESRVIDRRLFAAPIAVAIAAYALTRRVVMKRRSSRSEGPSGFNLIT